VTRNGVNFFDERDMGKLVQTIRIKIIFAFGACVLVMAAIGLFGILGLSRVNSNVADGYVGNTVPIADLSEVRVAQLNVRLLLRRIQVFRDPAKTAEYAETIAGHFEQLNKSWNHYYSSGISSDKERAIADRIKDALPRFTASTNEALAAAKAGNFDAPRSIWLRLNSLSSTAMRPTPPHVGSRPVCSWPASSLPWESPPICYA
jgi:hypothetical protein